MRAVIQRVSRANVSIAGTIKASIKEGLLVLLAVEQTDSAEDIEWLSAKIVRLRVFNDAEGVMNRSVQEAKGEILAVSQFTLFASTRKGNAPLTAVPRNRRRLSPCTSSSLRGCPRIWAKGFTPGNSALTCKLN
jgi:D-tyrosyl-tRNA(Tyr) deacylase